MFDFFEKTSVFNKIAFDDDWHSYTMDGKKTVSVTKVTGAVVPPFIEKKALLTSARKQGVDPDRLLLQWKMKNLVSRAKGSAVHKYIETSLANKVQPYPKDIVYGEFAKDFERYPALRALMTGDPVKPLYDAIVPKVRQFISDIEGRMHRVRSELVIGSPKYMVCGMIDQIFYNVKSGGFEIWDWKTNTDFDTRSDFNLEPPCAHLDKCKLTEYSLQLQCYKRIFEEETGIPIKNLYLCWFSENEPAYKVFRCKDLENEAGFLLQNAQQVIMRAEENKKRLTREFEAELLTAEGRKKYGIEEDRGNQEVVLGPAGQNMAIPAGGYGETGSRVEAVPSKL
jgi:hypothetical protein